jgi:MscS family membrane protein
LVDSFLSYLSPDEGDAFFLFWAKQALISMVIIALFYVMSKVLRALLVRIGARLTALKGNDLDNRVLQRISEPAALLVNCAGLYIAIKRLPLPERLSAAAAGVLFIVNIVIIANIGYRVLEELLGRYGNRLGGPDMSRQLLPLVQKLCTIFLVGTALIITLKHFNYDILSLVTALGVGSLAIGLAAKDTLANMVSGFTLMIDRPFRIGDRIQLGSQVGDVIDIGLRSTKIKGGDNTILIIPNTELCNSTITNMAFPDLRVKGRINLGVAYGSGVEQAKALLVQTAASVPGVLGDPAPEAYFTSFGESALNLSLFFWVGDYSQLFGATDRINCAISKNFQQNGINIPFPTRTVFLEKEPTHAPQD